MCGWINNLSRLRREKLRRGSAEGEGDRVAPLYLLRADPITLTRRAALADLSRRAGEG